MRDITKLPNSFDLYTVKKTYRVNSQKAQRIIDEFVKHGLVEFKDGKYVKIEKKDENVNSNEKVTKVVDEKPIQQEKVEIKKENINKIKEQPKNESKSVLDEVVETKIPVPYEVVTDQGTFELRVCNKDELIVVLNRVTGYVNYNIKSIKCLRK